jgi:DNA-binding IclR family transcriptional regulator
VASYSRRVYTVARALSTLAREPRSAPRLAEDIGIEARSSLRLLVTLAGTGLIERVPDDHFNRYRIGASGRVLGAHLLLAVQSVEPHRSSARGRAASRGLAVRNMARALRAIAKQPSSAPDLATRLDIGENAARRIVRTLASLRIIERVPGDPVRKRYRVAERGRQLGALLLLAKQDVEPYRFSDHRVRR